MKIHPFVTDKNAKQIKADILSGKPIFPMIPSGQSFRVKGMGYVKVGYPYDYFTFQTRPEAENFAILEYQPGVIGRYIGERSINVEDIAKMPWKEAQERYESMRMAGGDIECEWQCVEAPFEDMKLVRCITDNPRTGAIYETIFLRRESVFKAA